VRGACVLPPGIAGVTDRIRVRSIVGRFLEHSRVAYFRWGDGDDDEAVFLSSADWMGRNMFGRVEVAWPVRHPVLRQRVIDECLVPLPARHQGRVAAAQRRHVPSGRRRHDVGAGSADATLRRGTLTMDLILWRHAEAEDARGNDDLGRALTERGRKQAERMAAWLGPRLPATTRIIASPALRCQQTVAALGRSVSTVDAIDRRGGRRVARCRGLPDAGGAVQVVVTSRRSANRGARTGRRRRAPAPSQGPRVLAQERAGRCRRRRHPRRKGPTTSRRLRDVQARRQREAGPCPGLGPRPRRRVNGALVGVGPSRGEAIVGVRRRLPKVHAAGAGVVACVDRR
jgi:hypothetical protein